MNTLYIKGGRKRVRQKGICIYKEILGREFDNKKDRESLSIHKRR